MINYKPLIREKIQQFFKENPTYSYGELMYSVRANLRRNRKNRSIDFLPMKDEDFYTGLDMALNNEREEN